MLRKKVRESEVKSQNFFPSNAFMASARSFNKFVLAATELVNYVHGRQCEKATKESDCGPVPGSMGSPMAKKTQTTPPKQGSSHGI